eukprot:5787046-Pyramimonas_sp.AAC.1
MPESRIRSRRGPLLSARSLSIASSQSMGDDGGRRCWGLEPRWRRRRPDPIRLIPPSPALPRPHPRPLIIPLVLITLI